MIVRAAKILLVFCVRLICVTLTASLIQAQCPVNSIAIKGRVEHPPRNATVRVQLFYPPDPHKKLPPGVDEPRPQAGEAAEAVLDGDAFTVPVEYLTNDSRTVLTFKPGCARKPQSVVVTLKASDNSSGNDQQEYDHVTLDFPRDFKSDDSQHYMLRSELVLNSDQP